MMARLALLAATLACLALNACSGAGNPLREALIATGAGAEPKAAPDFIAQSRPESLDYKPVGIAPPARAQKSKTPAEVKSMEADMDTLKAANEARGNNARRAGTNAAAN